MRNKNRLHSFRHAFAGCAYVLRTQPNMIVHLALAGAAVTLGLLLSLSPAELAGLVVTIGLVLVAELVNTAVEVVVDLAAPRFDPLAKTAKDVAAAAVLAASLIALVVGVILFGGRLIRLLVGVF